MNSYQIEYTQLVQNLEVLFSEKNKDTYKISLTINELADIVKCIKLSSNGNSSSYEQKLEHYRKLLEKVEYEEVLLDEHNPKIKLLDKSTQELKDTLLIANETEQIGHTILVDLERQGGQMRSINGKLSDVQPVLDRGSSTLKRMFWRNKLNRVILIFIVLLLVGILITVIALKAS